MRLLLQSSRRFLRRHPGQLLLAIIGIAAGVAVVTGVLLMRDVLVHALDLAGEELAGRDSIRIEHPSGRLDESLLTELAVQPGAPALVPVISARVRIDGAIFELLATDPLAIGTDARLALTGNLLSSLMRTDNGVAVNRATRDRLGLAEGDRFEVRIGGSERTLVLAGVLATGRELDDRLLMDIAVAQQLLGRQGELSWIEAPADSMHWLERHLPGELVLSAADQRRRSAARLTEGMRANLAAMSLLSLAVGLFVIYSVISFLLVQRRRGFGMLRAVGVTRGSIGALLALETFALSLLGTLLGLAAGTWLSEQLLELVRQPVAELYRLLPPGSVQPTATLYLAIAIATLLLAQLSTLAVWREARSIPPGQLVRLVVHARLRKAVPVAAALLLIAGPGVMMAQDSLAAALAGLFLFLMGFALLAPGMGLAILRMMRLPWRRRLPGRALGMLGAGRARIAPALSALSLALALSVGIGMMVLGFRTAVDDWVDRLLRADVYLTLSQGQIDQALVERVSNEETIVHVSSARQATLPDGRVLIAYDLPGAAWEGFEIIAGVPLEARRQFDAGQAVMVTEPYANRHDARVGDRIVMHASAQSIERPIAAIYRDYGSEQGAIAIDGQTYRRYWRDDVRDSLGLYLVETAAIDELRQAVAAIDEHAVLTERQRVREQTLAVFDRTFRISWALAVLVGLIALVALVSALLALGLERRREYATLRALGMTRGQLAALVITQTAGLAAAAALVAVPLSLAMHAGLTTVVQPRAFGWTLPLSWPLQPLLLMIPLAVLVGLCAGIYPAHRIARRAPAPELRSGA